MPQMIKSTTPQKRVKDKPPAPNSLKQTPPEKGFTEDAEEAKHHNEVPTSHSAQ